MTESLSTSSTAHAQQTHPSLTASALKPTVCGSAVMFLVNCAFNSCDQNRFAINKAGQFGLMNLQAVARILSGVQYPWVILASHCTCVH